MDRNGMSMDERKSFGFSIGRMARVAPLIATIAVTVWLASRSPAQSLPRLSLLVNEEVTPSVKSQYAMRGATDSIIVYASMFDPDNNGLFEHRDQFILAFTSAVPRNYNGPVCLDWEGFGFLRLQSAVGSSTFTQGVQAYLSLITLARQLRPHAQLGFYGLPMSDFWNRNEAWRQRNLALQPIINASDCVFPSVYDFYKSYQSPAITAERDAAYVRESVNMALEMSGGRPVYAYVHPRYHPSNMIHGLKLIPESEFKAHVDAVFDANYKGDRPDGVVWWGADRYFRWLGQQNFPLFHPQAAEALRWRAIFAAEIPHNVSDDSYFTTIHKKTLRQLSEVIQAAQ